MFKNSVAAFAILAALTACEQKADKGQENKDTRKVTEQAVKQDENLRISSFFKTAFQKSITLSPNTATRLGIKGYEKQWGDYTSDAADVRLKLNKAQLAELLTFDFEKLSDANKVNYRLFKMTVERSIDRYKWRDHNYPANQMFGVHTSVVTTMMNMHRIKTVEDAENYIGKLEGVEKMLTDVTAGLKRRASMGIMPPKFVYPMIIKSTENIMKGAPLDNGASDNMILADFKKKLLGAKLVDVDTDALIKRVNDILAGSYKNGYALLLSELKAQEKVATTDDGAWKLPNGEAFYNANLAMHTTTTLTADEIHNIGLKHVDRIHGEMRTIMKKVGFKGSLKEFFDYTRTDDKFFYPNTEEGKAAYLKKATEIIDTMSAKAPEFFNLMPKAKMEVRAVEKFREEAAGKAFYQRPSLDGSRPGVYYANLYDTKSMPIYQMEALAYHEGVPGHHFQIAIAQELPDVPMFRRLSRFTSYSEGWGLYLSLIHI